MEKGRHTAYCKLRVVCKGCNRPMNEIAEKISIKNFATHARVCASTNLYKCTTCEFLTGDEQKFRSDTKTCDLKGRKCMQCQITFGTRLKLSKHIDEKHPIIECCICGKKFITPAQLRIHCEKDHDDTGRDK